ncbi:RpiR family transcriptional regulator [Roseinatronobacter thiooxidans]|uniref:RpiR family transcriptional regulator n=1 Tax=Roseinatronobacter thiooxidans TaxID=121821 RepID=A0A2W7Q604_9RHOB|nr:MurR/RpiR family transcriptional regulator [Roseinatronobacter thiooxidans]PZX39587.1 RpiR family transcriptional regulator [Roseinatronobacter thiooxidans]
MTPVISGSYVARIRAALPSLHPSERRLADTILNFPGEIASYSATELAQLANVSNATVTRFVRRLGYDSFDQARQAARATQQAGAAVFRVSASDQGPEGALMAQIAQGRQNVENSFAAISLAEIDDLADAILQAGRVWIIGFRTAQAFAVYLSAQIGQIVPNVTVLPQAGQTLAESLGSIAKDDVVIVFALRRTVRQLPALCRELGNGPARAALISDETHRQGPETVPVAAELSAQWRFVVQTTAPGPLFNHAAVLTLCHILATRVLERSGLAGRKRLLAIEALHDSLDEL